MQNELHGKIVQILQAAAAERDLEQKLRKLRQASELLLHADTPAEVVGNCLEHFTNLQADPHASLRRCAAHFLGRVGFCKPSLALRCLPFVVLLLTDGDGIVRELAAKAAITIHGRALFLLANEVEVLAYQKHLEHMHKLHQIMSDFLQTGCAEHPNLFRLVARWAKTVVLAQTPSPLVLVVRVPADLRGIGCLQDFPERAVHHVDLNATQQQAEELFRSLCGLLSDPPQGGWRSWQLQALLQCTGSVVRQRPMFFETVLDCWRSLLLAASNAKGLQAIDQAEESKRLIVAEAQELLASNLAHERHADVVEMLRSSGMSGRLEEMLAQAKYQQICTVTEKRPLEQRDGQAKRRRVDLQTVWSSSVGEGALADEDAFDGDALFAGESEAVCRKFEDYFGLPSQREPAGHVSGPSLLASRTGGNAELARLALTSLNSLALKRSMLRDRAHEKIVSFGEAAERGAAAKGPEQKAAGDAHDLALFLTAKPQTQGEGDDSARDPRAQLARQQAALAAQHAAQADQAAGGDRQSMLADPSSARLPADQNGLNNLQLDIFDEVLAAHGRMEKSPFCISLSASQVASFDLVSRQVALHLATGPRAAANPGLQRSMCQAFMLDAFETLKAAIAAAPAKPAAGEPGDGLAKAALGKLVELFYAKFTTDVAKWQDASGQAGRPASLTAAKTPLRDILEGAKGMDKRSHFTYAELFEMFIAEFERLQLPKRDLRAFLNEIPVVPHSAYKMLEAQCLVAPTRKMALLTVLSLVETKPACRWHCLRLLFHLAYSGGDDSSIRFDTIRLIINKIYSPGPHPPMRWQLPHLSDAEAVGPLEGADDAGLSWALPDEDFVSLQRLRGRCVEDVATMMLRSMAPNTAQFAFPIKVPLRVEQLRADLFKGVVCAPKDRVWLYLALCIKRPVLLHELVETFTQCDADMKEHLINSIEEALKYIPSAEKELLVLAQKATPETERLMIKVLHILVQTSQDKESLSREYGTAVTRLYGITQNPRLLVPVFDLLDRKHLLDFLPAVMQLEIEEVTTAFRQLIRSSNPNISISELLTELHHMNNPSENIVPCKFSMQALNVIFGMRDQFDAKVYGIVIQALVEESGPLPTLFMRTVIQVVKELPRLCDFIVMQILPRLVRQEVWGDDSMWRGFMIVLQHTFATQSGGAARVLAMLPMSQLEDVLVQHPDWKAQLREYVARQPAGAVAAHVRQLLQ